MGYNKKYLSVYWLCCVHEGNGVLNFKLSYSQASKCKPPAEDEPLLIPHLLYKETFKDKDLKLFYDNKIFWPVSKALVCHVDAPFVMHICQRVEDSTCTERSGSAGFPSYDILKNFL